MALTLTHEPQPYTIQHTHPHTADLLGRVILLIHNSDFGNVPPDQKLVGLTGITLSAKFIKTPLVGPGGYLSVGLLIRMEEEVLTDVV